MGLPSDVWSGRPFEALLTPMAYMAYSYREQGKGLLRFWEKVKVKQNIHRLSRALKICQV